MRRAIALVAVAASLVACGSSSTAASTPVPSPSPSPVTASPTPTPAGLQFKLNGIKTSAMGEITLTKGTGTITVELKITGLAADSAHVSHIHVGSCQSPGGILYALNSVVADGQGMADTRTSVQANYPPAKGHWYVVVHAGPDMQGANATYLLCGNLFT